MDYSNMWWNDVMEIPLMIKHIQIINHFEKKYSVNVNRELTFQESKFISESITKIKFLKTRKLIDATKAQTLFRLITSTDEDNSKLGNVMIIQFMSKTKK